MLNLDSGHLLACIASSAPPWVCCWWWTAPLGSCPRRSGRGPCRRSSRATIQWRWSGKLRKILDFVSLLFRNCPNHNASFIHIYSLFLSHRQRHFPFQGVGCIYYQFFVVAVDKSFFCRLNCKNSLLLISFQWRVFGSGVKRACYQFALHCFCENLCFQFRNIEVGFL